MVSKKGSSPPFLYAEKIALTWFLLDTFTHLTIELGYVYLTLNGTAEMSDSIMGGKYS
jgi:hypothetical protein